MSAFFLAMFVALNTFFSVAHEKSFRRLDERVTRLEQVAAADTLKMEWGVPEPTPPAGTE
ncbi:MAG TPA: hypothetical protein PLE60_15265 [Candidatus Latescibacteria bacterium]|nr:MAG: hypothetical protein BWY06_02785 [Candidatus Latescibacteria bacterium ADurb.Bin168]HPU86686.1 hypothetical protein [Candidatus Latescibacterota bacterium]